MWTKAIGNWRWKAKVDKTVFEAAVEKGNAGVVRDIRETGNI